MAEQESNVCTICGGVKQFWYKVEMLTAMENPGKEVHTPVLPAPFRICGGHPEPAPKHDGKLDERGDAVVSYGKAYFGQSKDIHIDGYDDGACLTPAQALSLLAWLRQEETELQRLAKEQDAKTM